MSGSPGKKTLTALSPLSPTSPEGDRGGGAGGRPKEKKKPGGGSASSENPLDLSSSMDGLKPLKAISSPEKDEAAAAAAAAARGDSDTGDAADVRPAAGGAEAEAGAGAGTGAEAGDDMDRTVSLQRPSPSPAGGPDGAPALEPSPPAQARDLDNAMAKPRRAPPKLSSGTSRKPRPLHSSLKSAPPAVDDSISVDGNAKDKDKDKDRLGVSFSSPIADIQIIPNNATESLLAKESAGEAEEVAGGAGAGAASQPLAGEKRQTCPDPAGDSAAAEGAGEEERPELSPLRGELVLPLLEPGPPLPDLPLPEDLFVLGGEEEDEDEDPPEREPPSPKHRNSGAAREDSLASGERGSRPGAQADGEVVIPPEGDPFFLSPDRPARRAAAVAMDAVDGSALYENLCYLRPHGFTESPLKVAIVREDLIAVDMVCTHAHMHTCTYKLHACSLSLSLCVSLCVCLSVMNMLSCPVTLLVSVSCLVSYSL
jgi:hypothetical protein